MRAFYSELAAFTSIGGFWGGWLWGILNSVEKVSRLSSNHPAQSGEALAALLLAHRE